MKTLKTFYKYKKVMLKFTSKKVVKNITSQTKTNKKKVKNITFERRRGGGGAEEFRLNMVKMT